MQTRSVGVPQSFSRLIARLVLAVGLALGAMPLAAPGSVVEARGPDSCPEPNDAYQQACYLEAGETATGYLFHANDIDAYRFEALDFGATARARLVGMPAAYRLELRDWNGDLVSTSTNQNGVETIESPLGPPGSYYLAVDSRFGEFSDDVPYRLNVDLNYPTALTQRVYYAEGLDQGEEDEEDARDTVNFVRSAGKLTIAQKAGGTPEEPNSDIWDWVVTQADFTLAVDARLVTSVNGGYAIDFGWRDEDNYYFVLVDDRDGQVTVGRYVDDDFKSLAGPIATRAVRTDGGVNRTVVRSVGGDLRVNMNGQEVVHLAGQPVPSGKVRFRALTWGDPATVNFDNILITLPPSAPGTVLLSDSFDVPDVGTLPAASSHPGRSVLGYVDGEYMVRNPNRNDTQVTVYPYGVYGDASIEVDVRLVGGTERRYVALTCRDQDTEEESGYKLTVEPETGEVKLARRDDGDETVLVDWTASSAVRRGNATNHLELQCGGTNIIAFVNGTRVASARDATYDEGRVALKAGSFSGEKVTTEARFDNLVVTQR